jgi:hypothetical protein
MLSTKLALLPVRNVMENGTRNYPEIMPIRDRDSRATGHGPRTLDSSNQPPQLFAHMVYPLVARLRPHSLDPRRLAFSKPNIDTPTFVRRSS